MATGYGTEAWCADGYVSGRFVSGKMAVALALYRRLITPRGTLAGIEDDDDEGNYGLDIAAYIGAVGNRTAMQALPPLVRGELLKDDRVRDVSVVATETRNADGTIALLLEIDVVLQDDDEEFSLTVSADTVSAQLLGVDGAQ